MIIEQSEFKGNPMLVIKNDENDRFPFSFGIGKAKKILAAIEEIKKWREELDNVRTQLTALYIRRNRLEDKLEFVRKFLQT
jgi:CO dehydrogenase nickel-insertion accessory protein CooC1